MKEWQEDILLQILMQINYGCRISGADSIQGLVNFEEVVTTVKKLEDQKQKV
jgi:hypothetical protein